MTDNPDRPLGLISTIGLDLKFEQIAGLAQSSAPLGTLPTAEAGHEGAAKIGLWQLCTNIWSYFSQNHGHSSHAFPLSQQIQSSTFKEPPMRDIEKAEYNSIVLYKV